MPGTSLVVKLTRTLRAALHSMWSPQLSHDSNIGMWHWNFWRCCKPKRYNNLGPIPNLAGDHCFFAGDKAFLTWPVTSQKKVCPFRVTTKSEGEATKQKCKVLIHLNPPPQAGILAQEDLPKEAKGSTA